MHARVKIAVKRQLRHIVGADSWRLFEPDTMHHCADAKDGVPAIGGAPYLTGR